jgi:hypothetical protein
LWFANQGAPQLTLFTPYGGASKGQSLHTPHKKEKHGTLAGGVLGMVEGRLERLKCSHVSTLKVKAHHSSHFSPLFVSGSYVGGASKGQSLHPFHLLYTA